MEDRLPWKLMNNLAVSDSRNGTINLLISLATLTIRTERGHPTSGNNFARKSAIVLTSLREML